MLPYETLHGT